MSVLIDRISIEAFRGIPGALTIDLDSELTVLYASNGTGKTSVFSALEWLLCNSDPRKPEFVKNLSRGQTKTPIVNAEGALIHEDSFVNATIGREFGSDTIGRWANERHRGPEFLSLIASSHDLAQFSGQGGARTRKLRQIIRATRFLSTDPDEALKLIPEDQQGEEFRSLLFADLTNTTNLNAELLQTRKYKDVLEAEARKYSTQFTELSQKRSAADDELKTVVDLASLATELAERID